MKTQGILAGAMIGSLLLAGCGGGSEEVVDSDSENPTGVTETGTNVNNPFGALSALTNAGQNIQAWQEEIQNMEPTDPVSFNTLIAALPDVPEGWTGTEPRGATNSMGLFSVSNANRSYTNDETGARVDFEITDWAYNQLAYAPFMLLSQFSQESTEGYQKGITVGEDPGHEEYTFDSMRGTRQVLFRKRFHTKIDVRDLPAEELQVWWERYKVSELPEE